MKQVSADFKEQISKLEFFDNITIITQIFKKVKFYNASLSRRKVLKKVKIFRTKKNENTNNKNV